MRHPGREAPHPGQLLALDQLRLVLLQRGRHGVELARQRAELVRAIEVDVRLEVARREPRRAGLESSQWPGDGAADGDAHPGGEERGAQEQRHDPAVGPPLDRVDLGPRGRDAGLERTDQLLGAVLDARHDELRARMLGAHEGSVLADHGRDDAAPEDPVQLGARGLDVVHGRALRTRTGAHLQGLRDLEDALLRPRVEAEVALVADDDGMRLVGVLIADRARELEGQSHALLLALHALGRRLHATEPGQRDPRRRHQREDQEPEPDEQAAGGTGPVVHEGRHRASSSKERASNVSAGDGGLAFVQRAGL